MSNVGFRGIFSVIKPIIGMIHLAGEDTREKIERAKRELRVYDEEGLDGAILENYHGNGLDLKVVLAETAGMDLKLARGVNFLGNWDIAFEWTKRYDFKFIQIDSVQSNHLILEMYEEYRQRFPEAVVLGGVGFKYTNPSSKPLERELRDSRRRCEAIVTTGSGTGIETPIEKLREYKRLLGDFPLIVGAGVNLENVREQLQICDGAIIGSYFKPEGDTQMPVDRRRVRELMDVVREVRKE